MRFVLRAFGFLRHSSFGIHHSPAPSALPDPRLRIAITAIAACLIAAVHSPAALGIAAAATLAAVYVSGIRLTAFLARLVPLNCVMLLLAFTLPLTTAGERVAAWGPLVFAREGFALAALVAVKGNLIVLLTTALVGSIDETTFGHALSHLRVPDKLAHLTLFTVRYLDVLHQEYGRLRAAMKVRGFRARFSRHTWRSLGYLAGMLLVRSFERADRVTQAMKCRGFRGHFYLLDHFALTARDIPLALSAVAALGGMIAAEWFPLWTRM